MTILDRIHRWFDYDEREERRIAARSKAVDLDIALADVTVTHEQVADAIRRGTTTLRTFPTALLKPQDIDRAATEVMRLLDPPVFDTGGEHGDIDAIRRAVQ